MTHFLCWSQVTWPSLDGIHPGSPACLHIWKSVMFKNWNRSSRFWGVLLLNNSSSHWSDFSLLKLHCSQRQKRRRQQEWVASHQFLLAGSFDSFWQKTNKWSGPVNIITFYHNYCYLLVLKQGSIISPLFLAPAGLMASCCCSFLIMLQHNIR